MYRKKVNVCHSMHKVCFECSLIVEKRYSRYHFWVMCVADYALSKRTRKKQSQHGSAVPLMSHRSESILNLTREINMLTAW